MHSSIIIFACFIHFPSLPVVSFRAVASMRQDEAVASSWFWHFFFFFLQKNATQNANKSISEPLVFKIFWGEGGMPPDPPSGSRLWRSKLASSCSEVWLRPCPCGCLGPFFNHCWKGPCFNLRAAEKDPFFQRWLQDLPAEACKSRQIHLSCSSEVIPEISSCCLQCHRVQFVLRNRSSVEI